jgi:hypothetical protein
MTTGSHSDPAGQEIDMTESAFIQQRIFGCCPAPFD